MALELIEWQNDETVLNEETMNKFQDNIKKAILSSLPIGIILEYSLDFLPSEDFKWVDGQAISRTEYSILNEAYAEMGYPYGNGDGSTTFNLPDRRENIAIGYKEGSEDFGTLGKVGGSFSHLLTEQELPHIQLQGKYKNFNLTANPDGFSILRHMNESSDGTCPVTDYIGDGKAIDITPKHIVCNYIIKVK